MSDSIAPMGDSSSRRLTVRAALRTDVGLVRSENQDFGACTSPDEELDSQPGGRLLIVADGMGGHRGGATASRLATETVKAQYLGSETSDIPSALRDALTRANARIYSESQSNPDLRGMGTTTSVLAVREGAAWFAHVGDSRIYMVRNGEIKQLTDDHSLVASMVREGLLTSKEAENHPRRNVLQRSMGVSEEVDIDVRGPFEIEEGDTFILCSDGLHGVVKEPELQQVAALPVNDAAEEFVRLALERGAPDNVTVIVARVEVAADAGDDTLTGDRRTEKTAPMRPLALEDTLPDVPAASLGVVAPAESSDLAPVDPSPAASDVTAPATPVSETPAQPSEAVSSVDPNAPTEPRRASAAVDVAPVTEPASTHPTLKWTLLVVLVLGAAGALLYWTL